MPQQQAFSSNNAPESPTHGDEAKDKWRNTERNNKIKTEDNDT